MTRNLENETPSITGTSNIDHSSSDSLFPITARGHYSTHGDSPTMQAPATSGDMNDFKPEYICVLYLRFENSRFMIRQAYKKLDPTDGDQDRANKAIDIIEHYGSNTAGGPPAEHFRPGLLKFGFNSQQVVAIFIDNVPENLRFNTRKVTDEVISFAPFSSQDSTRFMRPNNNFYNLRSIKVSSLQFKGNELLFLDFYNRNGKGNRIRPDLNNEDTWYWYSLNIHMLMKAESETEGQDTYVPVIFDPDTGNMGTAP